MSMHCYVAAKANAARLAAEHAAITAAMPAVIAAFTEFLADAGTAAAMPATAMAAATR